MKRILTMVALGFVAALAAFSQETPPDAEAQQRLQLAISSEEYPVTPGDVYRLSYRQGDVTILTDLLGESNYTINLKVFGSLNTAGMTFATLKPVIEKAVAAAYPRSMPSLTILSIGIFQVFLRGETPQSLNIVAWGLSRLSEIVESRRGPEASLRNVGVVSRDGKQKTFDLFRAYRFGAAEEDPFVKPGDTIVLSRIERRVEIAGTVHRPGTYELLAGEQLRVLVETYGDGLTDNSDVSRLRIQRVSGGRPRIEYVSLADGYREGFQLANGDVVTIPAITENLPVVAFEGAVVLPTTAAATTTAPTVATVEEAAAAATPGYNRIFYTFMEGETLADAVRAVRESFAPLADLSSASVIRAGQAEPITVDLRELLARSVAPSDMPLRANDRIVIPLLRFSVFISGAVENPGTYPYAPGRTYHYYVTLAGGSTQDAPEKIFITDVNGRMRDQREAIQSEDRIFVIPADVMVQGAVFSPGSFSYREGLPASYYVNLAGGIDPERNGNRKFRVYDSLGKRRESSELVKAGDRIYVPNNGFMYNFTRYSPLVVTLLGIVLTSLEIWDLVPR